MNVYFKKESSDSFVPIYTELYYLRDIIDMQLQHNYSQITNPIESSDCSNDRFSSATRSFLSSSNKALRERTYKEHEQQVIHQKRGQIENVIDPGSTLSCTSLLLKNSVKKVVEGHREVCKYKLHLKMHEIIPPITINFKPFTHNL